MNRNVNHGRAQVPVFSLLFYVSEFALRLARKMKLFPAWRDWCVSPLPHLPSQIISSYLSRKGDRPVVGKYLTEFIGTFFLVLTIALAVRLENAAVVAPIAIGSVLMLMVYMGGHISGAHYNPAVTLGVLLRGKCSLLDALPYMLCQFLGAVVATFCAGWLAGGDLLLPAPSDGVPLANAVVNEAIFTFALVLVVLNVATSPKTEGNSYYGLAIGFTILVAAFVGGGISGGAYNPAVGCGPILANMLSGVADSTPVDAEKAKVAVGSFSHFWIYLAGPFAGAVVAALVYHLQHLSELKLSKKSESDSQALPSS